MPTCAGVLTDLLGQEVVLVSSEAAIDELGAATGDSVVVEPLEGGRSLADVERQKTRVRH